MKKFLIFPLFFISHIAFANQYYVAPDGDDTEGTGGINAPFASLEKACNYVGAGDTVFMRGGIYGLEEQRINHETDGTAENPVVFMAYPGEEPVIDGSNINLPNNGALLFVARWNDNPVMSHVVIDGISVRNSGERGISYYKTKYLTVKNCKVYNIQKRGIGGYGHFIYIENNEIHHAGLINENGVMGSSGWPMMIYATVDYDTGDPSAHVFIRNNFVHQSWGEGIGPGQGTDDVIIEGNTVKDVWSVGIYCDKTTNAIIRNNQVFNTNPEFYRFDEPAVGITMANEISFHGAYQPVQGISIYNNLISNVRYGVGFWFDSSNSEVQNSYSNIMVAHNVIYNPTQRGIYMDDVPDEYNQPLNCRMHNNIIGFGEWQSEVADLDGWQVSHNNWMNEIPTFSGSGAISVDPLFENPGTENTAEGFRLTSGSECIAAGVALAEVETDYWGTAYSSIPSVGIHATTSAGMRNPFQEEILLFPNPSANSGFVFISTQNNNPGMVTVMDMSNRNMLQKSFITKIIRLDISGLPAGMYIVYVHKDGQSHTEKIIIQ